MFKKKPTLDLTGLKIPQHVAIIMDGNGRWAKKRGLPRQAGHRAGVENLRTVIDACVEFGVKILTVYAFSTENWERPEVEVRGLMRIFARVLDQEIQDLHEQGVCLHHLGDFNRVDPKLQEKVTRALHLTEHNDRLILNIAFNYGGRAEILHAVRQIMADGIQPEDVTEDLFNRYLFTAGLPDPDMIIRTSGEQRISNFLICRRPMLSIIRRPLTGQILDGRSYMKPYWRLQSEIVATAVYPKNNSKQSLNHSHQADLSAVGIF